MNLEWVKNEAVTVDAILSNTTLFNGVVLIMSSVDHRQPNGACCGKSKAVAELFLNNKDRYISAYEKVTNRTILPKWKGLVYFSSAREMINADILTDDDILELIRSKKMSKSLFDFSSYNGKIDSDGNNDTTVEDNALESKKTVKKRKKRR